VIELRPSDADRHNPNVGFEFPENQIEQAALEIYDGLIEYIKSFYMNNIDQATVNRCKKLLDEMTKSLDYLGEESFDEEPFDFESHLSN
jgi:hypothetical protein